MSRLVNLRWTLITIYDSKLNSLCSRCAVEGVVGSVLADQQGLCLGGNLIMFGISQKSFVAMEYRMLIQIGSLFQSKAKLALVALALSLPLQTRLLNWNHQARTPLSCWRMIQSMHHFFIQLFFFLLCLFYLFAIILCFLSANV